METKNYNFRLLLKSIIWDELSFAIEAPDFEKAKEIAIEYYKNPYDINIDTKNELLVETLGDYAPEDDPYPTKELYSCDTDKLIITDKL